MSSKKNKLTIGISIGDVNGIGPEVIIKTLADSRILNLCSVVIYGNNQVLSFYKKQLGEEVKTFNYTSLKDFDSINQKSAYVHNCWKEDYKIQPGVADPKSGRLAHIALEAAVKDLASNRLDALVTAPIDKHTIQSETFNYHGHTEYLEEMFEAGSSMMFMVHDQLRVGLVTNHLPIGEVAQAVTTEKIIEKIKHMEKSLIMDFRIEKPKIAVLGLNPHAGDNGTIGSEESDIIIDVIKRAKKASKLVIGPYSADGLFGSGAYKQFDGILAMYHDQGLIPFKTIAFGGGVNFTAGLPVVRTSPDHGTAYDIAGKNKANPDSMRSAIFKAIDIVRNRRDFLERTANPLKKSKLETEEI